MPQPPLILIYGYDRQLVETRAWIFERSDLRVRTAFNPEDLKRVWSQEPVDLFMLCDSLSTERRTEALALMTLHWPSARRLVVAPSVLSTEFTYTGPVFYAGDGPGKLVTLVHELLAQQQNSKPPASIETPFEGKELYVCVVPG